MASVADGDHFQEAHPSQRGGCFWRAGKGDDLPQLQDGVHFYVDDVRLSVKHAASARPHHPDPLQGLAGPPVRHLDWRQVWSLGFGVSGLGFGFAGPPVRHLDRRQRSNIPMQIFAGRID